MKKVNEKKYTAAMELLNKLVNQIKNNPRMYTAWAEEYTEMAMVLQELCTIEDGFNE